jgi:thiamine-monophosphate kinase
MIELESAGEFELIDAMRERWGALAVGIGDDAAVLDVPRGERLLASTDTAVEGRHFRDDWLTSRETARRAVAGALSDLAAMAAAPIGVLVAIQLPEVRRSQLPDIADGIADAVRAAGTVIVGGNLSGGNALTLTTTVLGSAYAPLMRSGARAGDMVYVTGALGGPAAALRALAREERVADAQRERLVAPTPRLMEARWLAQQGCTAAIDISDGLAGDAAHVARASGVTIEIDVARVPVFAEATEGDALAGGEEYELLVTAPALDVDAFTGRFGLALTAIGAVTSGAGELRLLKGGNRVAAPGGYDHFSR